MTLQILADRIGTSKGWLEKLSAATVDWIKLSIITEIAEALEIDIAILLDLARALVLGSNLTGAGPRGTGDRPSL
ncbi:hypothetical protein OG792_01305 [Micromonospora sp. NBC_01699]|uniref:hypothetical protein n=1 Tax=Micromonospora sp. NBC_01699 TaxID=2975984 RepID=UPI002E27FBAD|nr:hypothetical protein [Micromonospora sp. NBC_01699]